MYAEVAWVIVSVGTQVKPQIILDPDYLPDYLSVSYDYGVTKQNLAILISKYKFSALSKSKFTYCFTPGKSYHVFNEHKLKRNHMTK